MGNKEGKKTNALVDQERNRTLGEHNTAMGYLNPERANERNVATDQRNELWGAYKNFASGDAFKDANGNPIGGGGGGGANYQLSNEWKDLGGRYNNLAGNLEAGAAGYRGMAGGGKWDDRIRGVYGDFADTGGLSNDDVSNLRGRGIAGIGGYFDAARREAGRRASASGANRSLFGAFDERAARGQARAISDASRDTELGITAQRNEGKLAGASGLMGLDNASNQNRLASAAGLTDIGKFGYGGLEQYANQAQGVADRNASSAASAGAAGAANDRFQLGMRMDALDRMAGLYGSSPGELSRYDDMIGRERGMAGDQQGQNLNLRASYNPNRSGWDRAMQIAGVAGNVAGIWNPFGGVGSGGNRRNSQGWAYDTGAQGGY